VYVGTALVPVVVQAAERAHVEFRQKKKGELTFYRYIYRGNIYVYMYIFEFICGGHISSGFYRNIIYFCVFEILLGNNGASYFLCKISKHIQDVS
jgi:hypothetical protein